MKTKILNLFWILRNIKTLQLISENKESIVLITNMFEGLKKAAEEERPIIQELGYLNVHTNEKVVLLRLWYGVNEGNPIERLSQVIEQRNTLKDLLARIEMPSHLKKEAEHLIKFFK